MHEASDPPRVLCVDDEPNVLEGLERTLFEHFDVTTATSGAEGLQILQSEDPFAVVVSDMRMPIMDGAAFLAQAREAVPNTVRVLLTGQADMDSAISAVNDGNIFRFLCKPCPQDVLLRSLGAAAEQNRLLVAEKELLENTLRGAVEVLSEVLSIASPTAFSRCRNVRSYVAHMTQKLGIEDPWKYDLAALLCQVGCISLPPETLDRVYAGQDLSAAEQEMLNKHPEIGHQLLAHIPRLEQTAAMIRGQLGTWQPPGEEEQLGAEMLSLALALDRWVAGGASVSSGLAEVKKSGNHSAKLLDAMAGFRSSIRVDAVKAVFVREMRSGMVLDEDVRAENGNVVVGKDRELSTALIGRLANFAAGAGLVEPIRVRVPT